jgi:uncharacterized protein YecT (DUF1311 family)
MLMKSFLGLTVALLVLICSRLPLAGRGATPQEGPCWQSASTQLAMNQCATQEVQEADVDLNKTYERFISKYADDPEKVARIKKAQRAWVAFRDAEVEALFAESDRPGRGSVWPMCRSLELAKLTADRTKQLKAILEAREGDVCYQ